MAVSTAYVNQILPKDAARVAIPGHVIQVVQSGTFSLQSLTSQSYAALSGLSVNITPTYSTSKILISVQLPGVYLEATARHMYTTVYRNSTNLSSSGSNGLSLISGNTSGGANWVNASFTYLDSPSTLSSLTYTVYARCSSAGVINYIGEGGTYQSITVMEIAQ